MNICKMQRLLGRFCSSSLVMMFFFHVLIPTWWTLASKHFQMAIRKIMNYLPKRHEHEQSNTAHVFNHIKPNIFCFKQNIS